MTKKSDHNKEKEKPSKISQSSQKYTHCIHVGFTVYGLKQKFEFNEGKCHGL